MNWFSKIHELAGQEYERYLPTAFDGSLSLLEKVNKVIETLNQIVLGVNTVADYVDGHVDTQNEKIKQLRDDFEILKEWLENEGLQERTVWVLNEWFDSGKLAQIINNDVFNMKVDKTTFEQFVLSTTAELAETAKDSIDDKDMYLVTAFNGHDGNKLDMYVSYAPDEFITLNSKAIDMGIYLRDPSPLYKNGVFYVAFTSRPGFGIAKSTDLVNWDVSKIELYNTGPQRIIAPQFFEDDDDAVYISASYSDGTTTSEGIYQFSTKILKATDSTMLNWTEFCELRLPTPINHIDTAIYKIAGKYVYFTKEEKSGYGVIKQYTSHSLLDELSFVQNVSFKHHVEGISLRKQDNKYYLYADVFNQGGYSVVIESDNLTDWKNERVVENNEHTRMQHFDLCKVDGLGKEIVNSAIKKNNLVNTSFKMTTSRFGNRQLKLTDFLVGGVFTPPLLNNVTYVIDDTDTADIITISDIIVPDVTKHYEIGIQIVKGNYAEPRTEKGLLFKFSATASGRIRTPNYTDFLADSKTYANTLIKLEFQGRDWETYSWWNFIGGLNTLDNNPVEVITANTTTLTPVDGQYYFAVGDSVVITKVDTSKLKKFGKFYIVNKNTLANGTTITLKHGGVDNDFFAPDQKDLVLSGTDVVYTFLRDNLSGCRKIEGANNPTQWGGKKANFLGDSITYGSGLGNSDNERFTSLIAEELSMVCRNYGAGGTKIARVATETDSFTQRYSSMNNDADIIFVFGGTNDYGHTEANGSGTASFGNFEDRTEETFYGALHVLYRGLIEKYLGKKIIVITPLHRKAVSGKTGDDYVINEDTGKNLKDYVTAIREVAEYYGLKVLDLYKDLAMNPNLEAIKTAYVPDGLHPNSEGHKKIADEIISFMRRL